MVAERDPVAEIIAACKVLRREEHRVLHEDLGTDLTVEALRRRLGPRRSIGSADAFPSRVGASTRPRVGCSNCCARKDAERNWIWWRRLLRRRSITALARTAIRPSLRTQQARGLRWSSSRWRS